MNKNALEALRTFDITNLPDLDTVVEGALELFQETAVPTVSLDRTRPFLVLASVNALQTGKIMFAGDPAIFADESTYADVLVRHGDIEQLVIVSASGGKHAVTMAEAAVRLGKKPFLFTNNPEAPARAHVAAEDVFIFPRNREPYSYNTSTYLGMILGVTREEPAQILAHIRSAVEPALTADFSRYDAYTFVVPARFSDIVPMVRTKFDELFGPMVTGRVFTDEEAKHAKTIVWSPGELFVSIGAGEVPFGQPEQRLSVALPEGAGYAVALMTAYFVVGRIQRAQPPYFKQSIERYAQQVSSYFNESITPIVE